MRFREVFWLAGPQAGGRALGLARLPVLEEHDCRAVWEKQGSSLACETALADSSGEGIWLCCLKRGPDPGWLETEASPQCFTMAFSELLYNLPHNPLVHARFV